MSQITRIYPEQALYVEGTERYDSRDGLAYLRFVGSPEAEIIRSRNSNPDPRMACPFDSLWRYELKIGMWLNVGGVFARYSTQNDTPWTIFERSIRGDEDHQYELVFADSLLDVEKVSQLMLERALSLRNDLAMSAGIPYLDEIEKS